MRDEVEIRLDKNPYLFISKESNELMDVADMRLYQTLPRQLPKGVNEDALNQQAASANAMLNSIGIVQLCLQVVLKGGAADLLVCFYCL
jgi:hypothetical protein